MDAMQFMVDQATRTRQDPVALVGEPGRQYLKFSAGNDVDIDLEDMPCKNFDDLITRATAQRVG